VFFCDLEIQSKQSRVGPTPLSPSTVERGRFLSEPVRSGSSPAIHRIPRPPAAALAAGGRGIHGSRRFCRLGVRGCVLAGVAEEEVAALEQLLVTAAFFSDGSAPMELRRGSAIQVLFAAPRRRREGFPFAGGREVAAPVVGVLEDAGAGGQVGVAVRRGGRRCLGTEGRRLPCREGEPPSPRFRRLCGGLRRRNVLREHDGARV
jgi:hypothetical protein